MAERTSVALRSRDLVRVGLTVTARTGTDMAETANGWLWRCYRLVRSVIVEYSPNGGHDWITRGPDGLESLVAQPTLAVDRRDNVWCWYHDLTTSYGYLSRDYGATWELFAQHTGAGAPRMAVGVEENYLALHDGFATLTVYRTTDGGVTGSPVYAQECPAQVGAMEFDRRGVLHLVYKDADNQLFHRYSPDPRTTDFSDPVSWGPGRFQTLAIGIEYGLFARFDGGLLYLNRTNETFAELAGSAVVPAGTFTPGYVGIWIDRRGQHWLTPKPAGQSVTSIWSGALTSWSDP